MSIVAIHIEATRAAPVTDPSTAQPSNLGENQKRGFVQIPDLGMAVADSAFGQSWEKADLDLDCGCWNRAGCCLVLPERMFD
jgi:hypothetical protein